MVHYGSYFLSFVSMYFHCVNHEHFYELLTVQLKKQPDKFRGSERVENWLFLVAFRGKRRQYFSIEYALAVVFNVCTDKQLSFEHSLGHVFNILQLVLSNKKRKHYNSRLSLRTLYNDVNLHRQ